MVERYCTHCHQKVRVDAAGLLFSHARANPSGPGNTRIITCYGSGRRSYKSVMPDGMGYPSTYRKANA